LQFAKTGRSFLGFLVGCTAGALAVLWLHRWAWLLPVVTAAIAALVQRGPEPAGNPYEGVVDAACCSKASSDWRCASTQCALVDGLNRFDAPPGANRRHRFLR